MAAIRSTIEKRTIRAPFAGRLGLRQVSLGQFLRSGAAIVSLQALDPIYFNFSLPQQNAAQIRRGQPVSIVVDAFPGETFAGAISAVNPGLDEATRAFQVQATVANTDRRLQPGMFGAADIRLPAVEQAVTVPLAAIVYNPYGNAVYLVEPDTRDAKQLTVRQQFVQTGAKRGDLVVIRQGVKAGAQVVTAGQLKLRNGSAVVVNNTVAVAASPVPQVTQP